MDQHLASCFISYSHADAELARGIATGLGARNYYVWIDEGQLKVGDSLVTAIGDAIDRVDFLIALVSQESVQSNWCNKEIALAMTGEINRRGISVLPCRVGDVDMPSSLSDKLYLRVEASDPEAAVAELDKHMRLHVAPGDPIPPRRQRPTAPSTVSVPRVTRQFGKLAGLTEPQFDPHSPVSMSGVNLNGVTLPRNDGTRGSALYRVPIEVEPTPDYIWSELFVRHWNRPSSWTMTHRPGIASVVGNEIILDGTTMDELERYHMATLRLAVDSANRDRRKIAEQEDADKKRAAEHAQAQRVNNAEIANRLKFN
ncbi:MAG: toll/interleukin-1 receptor domain-containing protein [Dehalococcoidia bacterium]